MLKTRTVTRRNTVTVDDRRAVLMLARARKPKDIATVSQENFVRRELKARLGWPQNEPASEGLKTAARELAGVLAQQAKELAAAKAKLVAEQAEKAKKAEQDALVAEFVTEVTAIGKGA